MSGLRRAFAAAACGGLAVTAALAAAAADDGLAPRLVLGAAADRAAAARNREWIEYALATTKDRVVQLPPGEITLDRAVMFRPEWSGVTLAGAGPGRTVLANRHTQGPYWENQTLSGQGTGVGYADGYTPTADRTGLVFPAGADITPYKPGAVVYLFRWDGYTRPDKLGQCVRRHRIDRLDLASRTVFLDAPADPKCDRAK